LKQTPSTTMFGAFKSTKVKSKEINEHIKHLRAEFLQETRGIPPRVVFSTNEKLDARKIFHSKSKGGMAVDLSTTGQVSKALYLERGNPTHRNDHRITIQTLSPEGTFRNARTNGYEKIARYFTDKSGDGPIVDVVMRWGADQNPHKSYPRQILLLPKYDIGSIPDPESLAHAMKIAKNLRTTHEFGSSFTPECVISSHPAISRMLEKAVSDVLGVKTLAAIRKDLKTDAPTPPTPAPSTTEVAATAPIIATPTATATPAAEPTTPAPSTTELAPTAPIIATPNATATPAAEPTTPAPSTTEVATPTRAPTSPVSNPENLSIREKIELFSRLAHTVDQQVIEERSKDTNHRNTCPYYRKYQARKATISNTVISISSTDLILTHFVVILHQNKLIS